jgi:hypothetical protein
MLSFIFLSGLQFAKKVNQGQVESATPSSEYGFNAASAGISSDVVRSEKYKMVQNICDMGYDKEQVS